MLKLSNISKNFKNVAALDQVNLTIETGDFFAILGPSGCGKTTMINIVAGLIKPDSGDVFIDDGDMKKIPPNKRNIGMIFQHFFVYPHLNVYENICYPLKLKKISKNEADKKVKEVADYMNISDLLYRRSYELSGGEKQRVALARAIVKSPSLFLLDEPFSSLDYQLKLKIRSELKKIHRDIKKTFIYVTHDQTDAIYLADRVAIMNKGEVIQVGTPEEIISFPKNLFVAKFIHSHYNILPAKVVKEDNTPVLSTIFGNIQINKKQIFQKILNGKFDLKLFILGKNIVLANPENKMDKDNFVHFRAEIADSIIESEFNHLFLNNGLEMLLLNTDHKPGDMIDAAVEKSNIMIFDDDGLIGKVY